MGNPLAPPTEHLLHDLLEGGLAYTRKRAARALGQLDESDPRIAGALEVAAETDPAEDVREAARQALQATPHQLVRAKQYGQVEEIAARYVQAKVREYAALVTRPYRDNVIGGLFGLAAGVALLVYLLTARRAGDYIRLMAAIIAIGVLLSLAGLVRWLQGRVKRTDKPRALPAAGAREHTGTLVFGLVLIGVGVAGMLSGGPGDVPNMLPVLYGIALGAAFLVQGLVGWLWLRRTPIGVEQLRARSAFYPETAPRQRGRAVIDGLLVILSMAASLFAHAQITSNQGVTETAFDAEFIASLVVFAAGLAIRWLFSAQSGPHDRDTLYTVSSLAAGLAVVLLAASSLLLRAAPPVVLAAVPPPVVHQGWTSYGDANGINAIAGNWTNYRVETDPPEDRS